MTSTKDALNHKTVYSYDGADSMLTRQDPGKSCTAVPPTGCTTMGYDADNELSSITYSDGATPN